MRPPPRFCFPYPSSTNIKPYTALAGGPLTFAVTGR